MGKSAKGSKASKSVKSVKVQKSMKSDKVGKAVKSEEAAKADEGERDNYIYKGIVEAILDLKDPTGSSLSAIEKNIQASLPSTKKFYTIFLNVLKSMVTDGDLLEVKGSYKLSPDFGERDNYIYIEIVEAILDLKDPTGSSFSAIEKNIQASLPSTNKWANTVFSAIEKNMQASLPSIYFVLKSMVTDGDLLEVKGSYKLSPDFGERDNY